MLFSLLHGLFYFRTFHSLLFTLLSLTLITLSKDCSIYSKIQWLICLPLQVEMYLVFRKKKSLFSALRLQVVILVRTGTKVPSRHLSSWSAETLKKTSVRMKSVSGLEPASSIPQGLSEVSERNHAAESFVFEPQENKAYGYDL